MPYRYMYGIDLTYLFLVVPAILICMWAQFKVKSTYAKYSRVASRSGYTADRVARMILDSHQLYQVSIEHVSGDLTDHYDPRTRVLRLSDTVYHSNSMAAIGVAAHEAGHACQHAESYAPLVIRNAIVPVCNFGSQLSMPVILLGILFSSQFLLNLGIVLFAAVTLFQLITLPVEFNASSRAIQTLENSGMFTQEEVGTSKKVLQAAALTYVGAMLVSLMNLLRLLILFGGRRRDD